MSRRLDISSLLCDDPPARFGLDALVHAAEEEQKRLKAPLSLPMILNPVSSNETVWSPTVKSEPSELANDADVAVEELLVETIQSPGDDIQADIDDELLSLVDDVKPRQQSSPIPTSSPPSMPPPIIVVESVKKGPNKKAASKPKPKASASKTKVKPAPKAKPAATTPKPGRVSAISKRAPSGPSRSRSTSLMPRGSVDLDSTKAEDDETTTNEANKLYCVCQTKYDEDRFMIACDRCDEWYHTPCVDMPDLEVDLVDQFICPLCVEKHPSLQLKTTYKQRCLYGLEHPDPTSAQACHRPARGAFSKYCSDECGIENVRRRIDSYVQIGGKRDALWEAVKNTTKREGTVYRMHENGTKLVPVKTLKSRVDREVDRLNSLLDQVVKLREELKQALEIISWREKLLDSAIDRAVRVQLCGWDQRLCFGDEEWGEFGEQVLESYAEDENGMDVDGETDWWCKGPKQCERHSGWSAIRQKDIALEKERTEAALSKLTTREREIRKRIEDMLASKPTKTKQPNGKGKQLNGDPAKATRKRKATS